MAMPTRSNSVLAAAKALQRQYEGYAYHKHGLLARRSWDSLSDDCQQEFIDIVIAVYKGRSLYNGQPIPDWVTDLVRRHMKGES